jgi:hypothetical protein
LLFSRGGRALTVISFVAVAWLGMSGRLYRGYLTSMGFGFENNLNVSLSGLESNLTQSYDNRPFNFTISQGDTLIWADQQVFIDSRLGLYAGSTDTLDDLTQTDLIELHSRTRTTMRYSGDAEQDEKNRAFWKSIFDRFEITHAVPRIAGRNPDYLTYNMLLLNPEFQLTILAPSVAVFYRNDLDTEKYQQYLADHRLNFLDLAFGQDVATEEPIERKVFPQPKSAYVSYLTSDREQLPPPLVLAQHYLQHIEQAAVGGYPLEFRFQLAFCYLAIRNANQALAENPDSALAFRLLGQVYYYLGLIEQNFAQASGVPYDSTFRMMQSRLAFHQSLIGDPDNIAVTERLMRIARSRNRFETNLRMARRLVELLQAPGEQVTNEQQVIDDTQEEIEKLESQLDPLYEQVTTDLEGGANPLEVAAQLSSVCPYTAWDILDEHAQSIPQNPETEFLRGMLAVETGREEEAYNTLLRLEPFFSEAGAANGYRYATYAALGHADYPDALHLKESETEIHQAVGALQLLLPTMPLSVDPDIYTRSRYGGWNAWTNQVQEETVQNLWQQAVILLEEGQNSESADVVKRALDIAPNSNFRPMLYAYLTCVSKEQVDPYPPAERIPVTADMFAEEPEAETEP